MPEADEWHIWVDWDKDYGVNLASFETGTTEGFTAEGNPPPVLSVVTEDATTHIRHGFRSCKVSWAIDTSPVTTPFTFGLAGAGLDDGSFNVDNPPIEGPFVSPTVERVLTGLVVGRSYTAYAWVYVPTGSLDVRLSAAGTSGSYSTTLDDWERVSVAFTATDTEHTLVLNPEVDPSTGTEVVFVDAVQVLHSTEEVRDRVLGLRTPLSFKRGRDNIRSLEAITPTECTFEMNNEDQELSPNNSASTYAGYLTPGRPIHVQADYDSHAYSMFYGFLDTYEMNPAPSDRSVTFGALDMLAQLAVHTLSTPVYDSLQTGEAIGLILDAVGWPSERRAIDHGATTAAWWYEDGTDALEAVKRLVASEGLPAFAYVDPNGNFVFRDRHHRQLDPRSLSPQATWYSGNANDEEPAFSEPFAYDIGWKDLINTVDFDIPVRMPRATQPVFETDPGTHYQLKANQPYEIRIESSEPFVRAVTPVPGVVQVNNSASSGDPGAVEEEIVIPAEADFIVRTSGATVTASLSRTSGKTTTLTLTSATDAVVSDLRLRAQPVETVNTVRVSAQDAESVDTNGPRSYDAELPWANPYDAEAIAQLILGARSERLPVITVTINSGSESRFQQVLRRELSDRVTIQEEQTFTHSDFFIEAIEHNINEVGHDHTATFSCEAARDIEVPNVFTFGVAGKGLDDGVFAGTGFVSPDDYFVLGKSQLGVNKLVY